MSKKHAVKLSTIAARVIPLAEAIRSYWDTELPKLHPHYPLVGIDEKPDPRPPQERQLRRLLSELPEEMLFRLLLIMYLGGGYFGTEDLVSEYQALRGTFDKPEQVVSQMMEKAPLGEYMSSGLEVLRQAGIDVDNMDLRPRKARKSG